MMQPQVSIVIPTCNGASTLPELLDGIAAQVTAVTWETVAVDSESGDGTVTLLDGRVDRLIRIAREEFDHGLARNLAIRHSSGELVVLIVQDAVPASRRWLEELTDPLRKDPALAGTFARQLPRAGASRLTRRALSRWVASREIPHRGQVRDRAAFLALSPMARFELCAFDNVCSCIRRSVWERHPFPAAPFAEDLEWAREVLLAGHALAFAPNAAVVHSHERSLRHELARTRLAHRRLFELFELRTIPTARHLARALAVTLVDHLGCLLSEPGPRPGARDLLRALGLAVVWPVGQFLGARAAKRAGQRRAKGWV